MTESQFIESVAKMHRMSVEDAKRGIKALDLLGLEVAPWIANREMFRTIVNVTEYTRD